MYVLVMLQLSSKNPIVLTSLRSGEGLWSWPRLSSDDACVSQVNTKHHPQLLYLAHHTCFFRSLKPQNGVNSGITRVVLTLESCFRRESNWLDMFRIGCFRCLTLCVNFDMVRPFCYPSQPLTMKKLPFCFANVELLFECNWGENRTVQNVLLCQSVWYFVSLVT